jgi:hypothetical protein
MSATMRASADRERNRLDKNSNRSTKQLKP